MKRNKPCPGIGRVAATTPLPMPNYNATIVPSNKVQIKHTVMEF
jgi:hypothetical protein